MRVVAGVLVLLLAPEAAVPPASGLLPTPYPDPVEQDWLAEPVLPACLADASTWPEEALTLDVPPLSTFALPGQDLPRPGEPSAEEFPRAISALEIQAWREEQELLRIRRFASDATLGLPLIVPQFALESLLPRGIPVGPSTFLYRTSSSSLPLVVLDQVLFHEAQFLANIQMGDDDPALSNAFTRGQKRLLRKSFFSGFRATYAVPGMTLDQVLDVASEQGILGYVVAPPLAGAVLYFKGVDQRIRPHDDLKLRIKLAGGDDWIKGARDEGGTPALSIELRLFDLPVGIISSFDISSRDMIPQFLGIGTSLDAVEDLLSREEALRNSEFRER